MAKLAILLAAFSLFLVAGNASIYRINLDFEEEEQQRPLTKCDQEFRRHQNLNRCQKYMKQQVRGGGGIEMDEFNPQSESLQQCCSQLRKVDRDCVCPVLREAVEWQEKQTVEEQQRQGEFRGEEIKQLYTIGSNIPVQCGIEQQRCPFGRRSLI